MHTRLLAFSVLCATPVLACGSDRLDTLYTGVAVMVLLGALLIMDRGVFMLASRTVGLVRAVQPSRAGPVLYVVGLVVMIAAWAVQEQTTALGVALPMMVVGSMMQLWSFGRSLRHDLDGHVGAQLFRIAGVATGMALLAWVG
jgi:hypothetical protein